MKAKLKVEQEFDVQFLHIDAGVRSWEYAKVNDEEDTNGTLIPCRKDDRWQPIIEVDTGKIINWKQGVKAEIHYKVCDDGIYTVCDKQHKPIVSKDGYVPSCLSINDSGYGDYIIMTVFEDGSILDWEFTEETIEEDFYHE